MPGTNGIQLAKKLKKVNPLIKIIFVTAYSEYAYDRINDKNILVLKKKF